VTSRQLKVPQTVLVQPVGDEAVLLDLTSERYFGLDEVGAHFWRVLTSTTDTDEAYRHLAEDYDVASEVLAGDLERFVDELVENGLLVELDA
jgi:hypothetical protein